METSEIIKKIRKIEITTKSLVSEIFSGEYHSKFKGQGLEFSEVREYQSGDSFKQIDWNVSAKMGIPYIKKFEETRELNVIFLVDSSASTVFGTKNALKSEYITEIAGLLSFSALSNNDKVGMLLFTDEIELYLPARKGKKNALRILREILYHEPKSKKTNVKKAIQYIYRLLKKRSIIFILSDFRDDDYMDSLSILAGKHDVTAIQIQDPAEVHLPKAGIINFVDPETGEKLTVNTNSEKIRTQYNNLVKENQKKIENSLKKQKVDFVPILTSESYIKSLMLFFKKRKKAVRGGIR